MRFGTAALKGALSGTFDKRFVADVMFNGARVLKDVPIIAPRLTDSGSSQVQSTGQVTLVYQDDFARSIAPKDVGDMLAPFGTQVLLYSQVSGGPALSERTLLGTYLITDEPKVLTTRAVFNGAIVSRGDQIDLTIADMFAGVQEDRFDTPGTAPDLSSVWREYQRLVRLPITRPASVPDAAIPTSVAYQEDKLQACYDLATVLDAVAYMTPDGTASMRPNVWPAAVDSLWSAQALTASGTTKDGATLVDVTPRMSNADVYNAYVVRGTDPSGGSIVLASAEVTDGPLRTRNPDGSLSPYRRRPKYYSSPYLTKQSDASAYSQQQLRRVSTLRSLTYDLTETFNPLREVGDVLNVYRLGESFVCRITDISRDSGVTQTLTVAVDRTLTCPPLT